MPDPTPDLVALADQVKFLSGDLNRRFEILSSSVNQLNSRMDALSTTRKVVVPFKPALGGVPPISPNVQLLEGDWLGGTTSGFIQDDFKAQAVFLVRGKMFVGIPNLSRIAAFRASVRISDAQLRGFTILRIGLQRVDINGNDAEPVAGLAWAAQMPDPETLNKTPVTPVVFGSEGGTFEEVIVGLLTLPPDTPSLPFVPGVADLQAGPVLGKEFVDNDRFRYFVLAEFATSDQTTPPKLVPQGIVVLESFEVDCIVA